jgi:hypothetical protein
MPPRFAHDALAAHGRLASAAPPVLRLWVRHQVIDPGAKVFAKAAGSELREQVVRPVTV